MGGSSASSSTSSASPWWSAVLVSLFVSFTLDPMLSSVWKDTPSAWMRRRPLSTILDGQQRMMDWLHLKYDTILRWAFNPAYRKLWIPTWSFAERRVRRATIRNRGIVLWMAFFTLLAAFGLLAAGAVKSEFVPRVDEGWSSLRIQTPVGSSLPYTTAKAEQVEAVLREFRISSASPRTSGRNSAWFEIKLKPRDQRKRSQKEIDDAMRDRLKGRRRPRGEHRLEPPDPHLRAGPRHRRARPHLPGRGSRRSRRSRGPSTSRAASSPPAPRSTWW
jgi:multidrug efflux pump subunit AcrB